MKKLFSLTMALLLMASLLLPTVHGAQEVAAAELQYIIREGTGTMEGVTELSYASDRYMIFEKQDSKGIMDINGTVLKEGPFEEVEYVGGDLFAVKMYGAFALCRGGKTLTNFRYQKIEKGYSLVRGLLPNGTIDHFDFSGNATEVPDPPKANYQIYDIIPERCILLRYVGQISNGTTPVYHYMMATPEGNLLYNTSSYSPIKQVTDGLFEIDAYSYCYYNLEGERAFGDEVPGCQIFPSPDGSSFILHYVEDDKSFYRVYDRWANYLFDIQAVHLDRSTNLVINYLGNDKILYQKAENDYVIIDLEQKVLQTLKGSLIPTSERPEEPNKPSRTFCGTTELGFVMYNEGEYRFYKADLSGSFVVPGNCRAYLKQKVIVSFYPDRSESIYTLDGKELFHGEGSNSAFPAGDFFGVMKNGSLQICTLDGQVIADHHYTSCTDSGNPHVTAAYSKERGGKFLIDKTGKELNQQPFELWNYEKAENVIFKRNDKFGLARIYTGEGNRFFDVPNEVWYKEGAEFCAETGLFNGTEAGRFSPEKNMTRAMLVTVLWRLEGEPAAEGTESFSDVIEDSWYTTAVQWATEKNIVNGVGKGKFNPNGNVTREQIATILCRYAAMKGEDTQKTADLTQFSDASQISGYAIEAMMWANAEGLIGGVKSGNTLTLQPRGAATRAQVATILMRYIQSD